MKLLLLICTLIACILPQFHALEWAVLVAGSYTWGNYRHQADVCHAYHLLIEKGFDPDRIIVMMYDDIANNPENPLRGVIRNHPEGPNLYPGVKIDYRESQVNPDNFVNILLGNKTAMQGIGSGRVLESGPEDRVFINFVDHGGSGLIAFPQEYLYASRLQTTLTRMYDLGLYKELVFYLEACESGSMFEGFNASLPVFATTAANSVESSYACNWDSTLGTFAGDVYSVVWMEDSEGSDSSNETLQQQYNYVKENVNTSHVCEFGSKTFRNEPVNDFIGPEDSIPPKPLKSDFSHVAANRDVPIVMLQHKIRSTLNPIMKFKFKMELEMLLKKRQMIQEKFTSIAKEVTASNQYLTMLDDRTPLSDRQCHETAVQYFTGKCGFHEDAISFYYIFNNLCAAKHSVREIHRAIDKTCSYQL
eukprot:Sdes_comp21990_c0_seq1m20528